MLKILSAFRYYMLPIHAELMRIRVPDVGIWWNLELLMVRGSTGQGRHQAELPVWGCMAPALCLSLLCGDSWRCLLACMQGWQLVPGSFLPLVPASIEKVLCLFSLSFISKLQAHIPSQEIKGSKYIQTFKAKLDAVRSTGKGCVCRLLKAAGKEEVMLSALQDLSLADKPSASRFGFCLGTPPRGVEMWFAVSLPSLPWILELMDELERKYLC